MSHLVRLYPRAWRERYGDEFDALLKEVRLSPSFAFDVLRSAAIAQAQGALRAAVIAPMPMSSLRRFGASAGVAGGGVWALTFLIGGLAGWGRNGRDWGFLLLVVAACLILVQQVSMASDSGHSGRRVTRGAIAFSCLGSLLLLASAFAAIAMEQPVAMHPAVMPPQLWEAGMLLTIVGSAATGIATLRETGHRAILAFAATLTTIPLAVGLLVVVDAPTHSVVRDSLGQVIAESIGVGADHGWFTTNIMVVTSGAIFGIAWLALAADRFQLGRTHTLQPRSLPLHDANVDDIGENANFHDAVSSMAVKNFGSQSLCVRYYQDAFQGVLKESQWVAAGAGDIHFGADFNDNYDSLDLLRDVTQGSC
ncbi:MAG: hypothetical protein U0667_09060 [Chloroflexota bacterium]